MNRPINPDLYEIWEDDFPIPPEGMTHVDIGEVLGITPQRVSQIELRALAKLRRQYVECDGVAINCRVCQEPFLPRRKDAQYCPDCRRKPK